MRTNIHIDDELMAATLAASGARTKREAVELAMETFVRLRNQENLRQLKGIGWAGDLEAMRLD